MPREACHISHGVLSLSATWSAAVGDTTSLLELNGTLTHPILGRGLAYRLTMPQVFSPGDIGTLTNMLNNWEMQGKLPAGPGAWFAGKMPDSLGFSGFLPTFCYPQGMAALVAEWMRRKHNSASFLLAELLAEGVR